MPRQPISADPNVSTGFEWPRAKVDAPDAFYRHARARLAGLEVTVSSKKGDLLASYLLDEELSLRSGVLTGSVDGFPFTVVTDCSCSYDTTRTPKGDA